MDLKRVGLHVFTFVITMTILWLMMRHAARGSAPGTGQFQYSLPARLFACFVSISLLIVITAFDIDYELRCGLIVLEFVCIGVSLDVFTTRIKVSEEYLEKRSLFGRRRILFSDISEIKRQEASQAYVVRASPNCVLKISLYINGIEDLMRVIRERAVNAVIPSEA